MLSVKVKYSDFLPCPDPKILDSGDHVWVYPSWSLHKYRLTLALLVCFFQVERKVPAYITSCQSGWRLLKTKPNKWKKKRVLASLRKPWNSRALLVGMRHEVAPGANVPAVPRKAKHRITSDLVIPPLGINPAELKTGPTCSPVSTAALFPRAERWKHQQMNG